MSKTGIYENLPLQPLKVDETDDGKAEMESLLKKQKLKSIQNALCSAASKPKKRKSTPEVLKVNVLL